MKKLDIIVLNYFGEVKKNSETEAIIYFTQVFAFDLGYRYKWTFRVYSNSLRESIDDYFSEKEYFDKENSKITLKPEFKEKLLLVKKILTPPQGFEKEKWIDLVFNLHSLKNIFYWPEEDKVEKNLSNVFLALDDCRQPMYEKNPEAKFSLEEFKLGWQRLEEFGILDKKHIREKIN